MQQQRENLWWMTIALKYSYLFSQREDLPLVHSTKLSIHLQVLLIQCLFNKIKPWSYGSYFKSNRAYVNISASCTSIMSVPSKQNYEPVIQGKAGHSGEDAPPVSQLQPQPFLHHVQSLPMRAGTHLVCTPCITIKTPAENVRLS